MLRKWWQWSYAAGPGAWRGGFVGAGIEITIAVEQNKYAAATYRLNFPKVDVIEEDIRSVSGRMILRKLEMRPGELDVLVAGLPCQGFSESNRRTRTMGNPKNLLYCEVLRLLSEIRPRWFVIENVAGIRTLKSGCFLAAMLEEFRGAGYPTRDGVLNAADFGVPQCRRRAFLVGTSTGKTLQISDRDGRNASDSAGCYWGLAAIGERREHR